MTLGISYALNRRLVVMGDLLLSGDETEHDVSIPSVGKVTEVFPKGSGYSIVGLTQKVIVICDDMAIAWAGHEVAARLVIQELRAMASSGLTPATLRAYLKQLPDDLNGLDLQLTGYFVYENTAYQINFDARSVNTPNCTDLHLIGTGAPVFESLLGQYQWETGGALGVEADRAAYLSTTMAFAGMLLELELKSKASSLHCYFGGGYEVVFGEDGAFRKLDDVTLVYWNIQVSGKEVGISKPFHIQKQFYRNGHLMIMPIRFSAADAEEQGITATELHVVAEPGATVSADELGMDDLPSLNSRNTLHYFIQGETEQVFTRFQYRQDSKDNDLSIVETETGLQLKIRKEFFNYIAEKVRNDPRWQP
jgi:hypothetical protein